MTARFADVLEISLAMSVVLAVLLALRPLLKKRLRVGAFYWVWLLAALRLCIPFNLSLPQAPVTVEAVPRAVYRVDTVNSNPGNHHYAALTEEEAASEEVAAENRPVDGGSIQDVYTPLSPGGGRSRPVAGRGGGVPGLASGKIRPLPPAGAPLGGSGGGRRPAGSV